MIKKVVAFVLVVGVAVGLQAGVASAHVVVEPAKVEAAAFQTFTAGVPNEKQVAVTKMRLVVPDNLGHVTPTVKPGWTIETVKQGEGDEAVVKEIVWSGGSIPAGQRDDFTFSAQAPEQTSTLQWKAYQTYADGEEVAWDQTPSSTGGHDTKPYSETEVINELVAAAEDAEPDGSTDNTGSTSNVRTSVAIGLSVVAIVLSVYALTSRR